MTDSSKPRTTWQHPCPQCGAPSGDPLKFTDRGTVTVHYKCSEGHIWLVKWVAAS